MPTYEYECLQCRHRFEEFQNMTDEPLRSCPVCGEKVRRLIGSGAAILFKGSGFYETDYKRKSPKEASGAQAKTDGSAGKEGGGDGKAGGGDGKAESKKGTTEPKKDAAAKPDSSGKST